MRRLFVIWLVLWCTACGGGGGSDGPAVVAPPPPVATDPTAAELAAASRFLAQATFGPTFQEIDDLARSDQETWLAAQFNLAPSLHMPIVSDYALRYGSDITADPPPGVYRRFAFWEQALTAPDQLRQLVAYALTQIFVVSDNVDAIFIDPRALASYYDMLLQGAFGNFRDLLLNVTLHPSMGFYLSHVNNGKSDPGANTFPDENYAREVMQLFSIGLFELNPDGSRRLDSNGDPIPTYDNTDIRELSKIFTGLSYGPENPGSASFFGNQARVMHVPMVMFDAFHEPGSKQLLRGEIVPDGQSGMADIEQAIDNLFNHPNVGPFIGKQLIQRLVTSNPSPQYVARVSAAFDGDGASPRGDMQAVIRAILLDPEAAAGERLQEPLRRYIALNRSLGARGASGDIPGLGYVAQFFTQQHVLSAPSVFNFYLPDFMPIGELGDAGLLSPEFQITNASTVVGVTNLMAYAIYGDQSLDSPDGFGSISIDLQPFVAVADDFEALLERIDVVFFAGSMDAELRTIMSEWLAATAVNAEDKVKAALYLALISPQYAVVGGR